MSYIGNHIKVILFDHDDTLVGTIEAKWAEHKHIARTYYGKELTNKELHEHWGEPLSVMIGFLYGTDDIEKAMAHNKALHANFPKTLRDDTIATLQHFHDAGQKLGVITATSNYSFSYDLISLGISRDLFVYTQTEDDTPFHKPDPRVFDPVLKWLKGLDIKPSEVVYVGDSLNDMKAALGAGFEFIAISTGLVTQEEFERNNATTIHKLSDLIHST